MPREELLLDSISCTEPIWLRISVEVTERDVEGVMLLVEYIRVKIILNQKLKYEGKNKTDLCLNEMPFGVST